MSQFTSIRHPESCPHLTMVLSPKALPKVTAPNGQTALVIHLPGAPLCHARKNQSVGPLISVTKYLTRAHQERKLSGDSLTV